MESFVSCVRFKGIEEHLETLEIRLKEFQLPRGAASHTIVRTENLLFYIYSMGQRKLIKTRDDFLPRFNSRFYY